MGSHIGTYLYRSFLKYIHMCKDSKWSQHKMEKTAQAMNMVCNHVKFSLPWMLTICKTIDRKYPKNPQVMYESKKILCSRHKSIYIQTQKLWQACTKYSNFKQDNILALKMGSGYRIFSLTKKLFAICKGKINFLQWNVIWYTNHSRGQARCLD